MGALRRSPECEAYRFVHALRIALVPSQQDARHATLSVDDERLGNRVDVVRFRDRVELFARIVSDGDGAGERSRAQ